MITGDHVITAKAIAKELGILHPNQEAITSEDLNRLTDAELYDNIEKYSVYARVAPEDKVRIVEAWQKKGMVVAMTGDGVNDSPALKKADIGCAMGITGTDVAKEAASMILTDDNFATIITAVKQGRGIYDNIRKTVHYLLASNIGEVLTMFLATLLSAFAIIPLFGLPLGPKHLLWINLITDTLPAFALGVERPEDDVMKRKPRPKNENFFAHGLGYKVVMQGIIIGLITLLSYTIGIMSSKDTHTAQTMAFLTLAIIQLFHAFNIKSDHTVFSKQAVNNRYLWFAFIVGLLLQSAVLYIPFLAKIFDAVPLSYSYVLISLGLAFAIVPIMETVKLFSRRIDKMKPVKV
jgi:Ca2+-transporting ATPase